MGLVRVHGTAVRERTCVGKQITHSHRVHRGRQPQALEAEVERRGMLPIAIEDDQR